MEQSVPSINRPTSISDPWLHFLLHKPQRTHVPGSSRGGTRGSSSASAASRRSSPAGCTPWLLRSVVAPGCCLVRGCVSGLAVCCCPLELGGQCLSKSNQKSVGQPRASQKRLAGRTRGVSQTRPRIPGWLGIPPCLLRRAVHSSTRAPVNHTLLSLIIACRRRLRSIRTDARLRIAGQTRRLDRLCMCLLPRSIDRAIGFSTDSILNLFIPTIAQPGRAFIRADRVAAAEPHPRQVQSHSKARQAFTRQAPRTISLLLNRIACRPGADTRPAAFSRWPCSCPVPAVSCCRHRASCRARPPRPLAAASAARPRQDERPAR